MIELVLVRHAKSDWDHPGLPDHDRPLNARGERDAPAMASRLASAAVRPARILSSTALRARTTAGAFGAALGVDIELDSALYGAPARVLRAAASASGAASVMVVAHNPGMTDLAASLSGGGIAHMPTCAVALFRWNVDDGDVAASLAPDFWELLTPH